MPLAPRAVLVHRRSEFDEVVARHGTVRQAAHFLRERGRDLDELRDRHERLRVALHVTSAAVPVDWRRAELERAELARFVFGPEDVIVVVGQDGLVANVAKYLDGQPVVGIDPDPGRNPGVLVPHPAEASPALLAAAVTAAPPVQERTMVEAVLDDGQRLCALNELYVGHAGHQSARYRLVLPDGRAEAQSSSGLLVGTGTGATGWLRSVRQERRSELELPDPVEPWLCWFVREAWPSPFSGTSCTEGRVGPSEALELRVESDELVCFGDGVEGDALVARWGQRVRIGRAGARLRLVVR